MKLKIKIVLKEKQFKALDDFLTKVSRNEPDRKNEWREDWEVLIFLKEDMKDFCADNTIWMTEHQRTALLSYLQMYLSEYIRKDTAQWILLREVDKTIWFCEKPKNNMKRTSKKIFWILIIQALSFVAFSFITKTTDFQVWEIRHKLEFAFVASIVSGLYLINENHKKDEDGK
jgi:hypothetical protein